MSLFIDASAAVALLAREPDYAELADRLAADAIRLWSAIAIWETYVALMRSYEMEPQTAHDRIELFQGANKVALVPIGEREVALAQQAFLRFGKGNSAAKLNMGDCFAYACAKANGAALLYKGDDFSKTDLA